MPWHAVVYLVILVGLGVYSAYDDLQLGRRPWYLIVDGAVTLLWVYFVLAFFRQIAAPTGPILISLFAAGVIWTIADVRENMRAIVRERPASYDPELSPRLNLWIDRGVEAFGLLVGVLIGAPAIAAGAVVAMRAW